MAKLVSILIPAYNAEKWIEDTIKSALDQTWPKKEIIIVNDGSSDDTLLVARRFASKSVKVITQENMGASVARNKALEFAQGDYVQWLDADDLLAPDKISQQLKESNDGPNARILYASSWGLFYFDHQKTKFIPNSLWRDLTPIDWILTKFNDNVWMTIMGWLMSRELTNLAGPWDERLSLDDDGEYICRVVSVSEKVKFVPEAKSYYRKGIFSSLSVQRSDKELESLFLSLSLSIDHLRSLEDSERTKMASLNYLQLWYSLLYPEKHDLLKKINNLAQELGGSLRPPTLSWKYFLIEKIFGYKVAKDFMEKARKTKAIVIRDWYRFLHNFSRQK
jgi:glycosyltransferase involved in cell wall biosynthesis